MAASKSNRIAISRKLLADLILVLSVMFLVFAIADAIIPGLISSRIDLYKLMIPLWLAVFAFSYLEKKKQPDQKAELSKWSIYFFSAILSGMLILVLRSAGFWLDILMVFFAAVLVYLIIGILSEK
jgi:hypothetical protein